MSDVTQILGSIQQGNRQASDHLLSLLYDELRRLAAEKLAQEQPGQTIQPKALCHEDYSRLLSREQPKNRRSHFFAAGAEAMRRILIEQARRRHAAKRGREACRQELHTSDIAAPMPDEDVLTLNDSMDNWRPEPRSQPCSTSLFRGPQHDGSRVGPGNVRPIRTQSVGLRPLVDSLKNPTGIVLSSLSFTVQRCSANYARGTVGSLLQGMCSMDEHDLFIAALPRRNPTERAHRLATFGKHLLKREKWRASKRCAASFEKLPRSSVVPTPDLLPQSRTSNEITESHFMKDWAMRIMPFALLLLSLLTGGNALAGEKKDRHGEDLSEQNFASKSMNGWNFSDCNLKNTTFRNSSLKNANFKDALMSSTIFDGADMTGSNMSGLKGPGASFDATNLRKSNWEGSEMEGARHTNFREANLKKTKFGIFAYNNCDFRGADFRGANLRAPTKIGFSQCRWKEAIYDEDTAFPDGFDPQAEGLILRKAEEKKKDAK